MNSNIDKMSPFIVMEVLERAQELQRQGVDIIHMEVGEPDFDVPKCVKLSINEAVNNGKTHYTHSLGDFVLRSKIAGLYKNEYNVDFLPDNVVVTSGSSTAILLVLQLLCNPNDEVIIFNPGYSCYKNFILSVNAIPVEVNLNPDDGFKININDIKAKISEKTRAIFINSPSNPFGTLIDENTMKQIASLNIPIISDEIYHGLVYKDIAHSILEYTDNAFVINGFSKRYAMTGLRLGYLISPIKFMRKLQIMQQNLFICAPSISQFAGISAIENSQSDVDYMKKLYNERRVYLINRLRDLGFKILVEPQAAFYIFVDARMYASDTYKFAFDILENAHVGVTPGIDFGSQGQGFLRFSYANSLENIVEATNRIEKYLKSKSLLK
ncbi:MAG: pyridoxal phosphate-dependent aminotransferase [Bacteroidales bacterium]|nr:pyridoxal phosphate-dependent aminotransferase [Bacteroidales bacterium]